MANTDNETTTAPPTNGGRITDELRHYIEGAEQLYGRECPRLRAIADRIDAAHEEAIQREHETAYDKGYDEGYASADDWLAEHEDAMAEHGWYQALDANKQVIHADDELFWKVDGTPAGRVTAIGVGQCAGWVWTLLDGHVVSIAHNADKLCHKQPTVEDVLRDFGKAWVEWEDGSPCDPIAEYAAKLRLADDGKEQ